MLNRLLQQNSCLGFRGMVQRALKSTYSKFTGAGLHSSDRVPSECSASTCPLMMCYDPGVKRKAGWTSEWGGAVSAAEALLKRNAF